jgi:hypothetical protein
MKHSFGAAAAICLTIALAACSGGSGGDGEGVKPLSSAGMLAQVRAAGALGNELDVQPLRDPQVEDLRWAASAAESRGDYTAAAKALAMALHLLPNDPDLLQWQAELALVSRDWAQAERWAILSYEKGPQLGGLCRRNWTTAGFAREAHGDAAGAAQARQRVAACAVTPPMRM